MSRKNLLGYHKKILNIKIENRGNIKRDLNTALITEMIKHILIYR